MTDSIEKLYNLVGVCGKCYDGETLEYPLFTFKKAVGLNNWLLNNKYKKYILLVDKKTSYYGLLKFDNEEEEKKFIKNDVYQSITGLVCELWEDLTDEQKQEIKRILE